MTQQGIVLPELDPSYVSAMSMYFIASMGKKACQSLLFVLATSYYLTSPCCSNWRRFSLEP